MPEAKLSDKLRNTEWNDDEYAMMELRHWYALCDEVAVLEAQVARLRKALIYVGMCPTLCDEHQEILQEALDAE